MQAQTSCIDCAHFDADTFTCEAFPERIPDEIREGYNDHRKPIEGDNGITYEPIGDLQEGKNYDTSEVALP